MSPTFLYTSFLIALALSDDALHQRAIERQQTLSGLLTTTEYALVEFADALPAEPLRALASQSIAMLRNDPAIQIVPATMQLPEAGLSLFSQRQDK